MCWRFLVSDDYAPEGDSLRNRFTQPQDSVAGLKDPANEVVPVRVMLESAARHPICKIVARVDADHQRVYLGDVLDGARVAARAPYVCVRKNGPQY